MESFDIHRTILETELARNFERYYAADANAPSHILCQMIEYGRVYTPIDVTVAVEKLIPLHHMIADVFTDVDTVLTLEAPSAAPPATEPTGNPVFSTLCTLLGLPTISLQFIEGVPGLPIGVQLIGAYGDDARLLRIARWLEMETRQ